MEGLVILLIAAGVFIAVLFLLAGQSQTTRETMHAGGSYQYEAAGRHLCA